MGKRVHGVDPGEPMLEEEAHGDRKQPAQAQANHGKAEALSQYQP